MAAADSAAGSGPRTLGHGAPVAVGASVAALAIGWGLATYPLALVHLLIVTAAVVRSTRGSGARPGGGSGRPVPTPLIWSSFALVAIAVVERLARTVL